MFWKKKPKATTVPTVANLKEFVEWLLRDSEDFADLRSSAQMRTSKFVEMQTSNILKDLDVLDTENEFVDFIDAGCDHYSTNFLGIVDTAGGFRLLPSHIHSKAFPLFVQLRVIATVAQQKYGAIFSEQQVAMLKLASGS